jgi:hypothetical protein
MARKVVRDALRLERHERVILSADPYFAGAMLEGVRAEIQRAGAIELATILHWTAALTTLRTPVGLKPDAIDAEAESRAMRDLFSAADVFIWLANDQRVGRRTHAAGQSEWVLESWGGRALHFHWFHDPLNPDPDAPANRALDLVYQDAILNLDYPALRTTMETLASAMANQVVRVTNPAGTDLSFRLGDRFIKNYGDASRARVATLRSPREREEEIPCGALRSIPVRDSVDGVLAFARGFGYPIFGYGLDFTPFLDHGLKIHFEQGRIVRIETGSDQARLDALWAAQTGDRDRLGEMVLGCNPLLQPVPGCGFLPYYGFGDAFLRLTIGENIESGGTNRSSLHRWMMLLDATIAVDGRAVVRDGKITAEGRGKR